METYIIKNSENRFGVLVQLESLEFAIDFKIFQITSEATNEEGEDTLLLDQIVDGSIKWDGCSNINYGDKGYIHSCSPEDIINMHKAIEFCWKKAEKSFSEEDEFDIWFINETNAIPYSGNSRCINIYK